MIKEVEDEMENLETCYILDGSGITVWKMFTNSPLYGPKNLLIFKRILSDFGYTNILHPNIFYN